MIRVYIVGEVRLYREGLEQVLGQLGTIEVVGAGAGPADVIPRIRDLHPDVVLLDLRVPDGPVVAQAVVKAVAPARVVALAMREVEPEIVAWAEAGIAGYVDREGSLEDLVAAVESVARGEMLCSPRVAAFLLGRVAALATGGSLLGRQPHLTSREREITRLVGEGLSNEQIARALQLALPTVKNHVHSILDKLEVHRRADVASLVAGWR